MRSPAATLPELFAAQVARTPDAVAVVFEDAALTYGELDARANQLAHHLRALGVGPEVVVGLCVERSLEMLVGLLGILKAGGAYLPLDPDYPHERLAFMLEDAGAPVLVTQSALLDRLPAHGARPSCGSMPTGPPIARAAHHRARASGLDPHNPAYVIYTSGSTGSPKGVDGRASATWCGCSARPSAGSTSARTTCGRCSTPSPSTSRSGRSGARCSMAAGWWSSPMRSAARPRSS